MPSSKSNQTYILTCSYYSVCCFRWLCYIMLKSPLTLSVSVYAYRSKRDYVLWTCSKSNKSILSWQNESLNKTFHCWLPVGLIFVTHNCDFEIKFAAWKRRTLAIFMFFDLINFLSWFFFLPKFYSDNLGYDFQLECSRKKQIQNSIRR